MPFVITPYEKIRNDFSERNYPWGILVLSVLLNRTTPGVAIKSLRKFLEKWPTPEALQGATKKDVEDATFLCGTKHGKAANILLLTNEYLAGIDYKELYPYVGWPGLDAYRMLVLRDFSVKPKDTKLLDFWKQHSSPEIA